KTYGRTIEKMIHTAPHNLRTGLPESTPPFGKSLAALRIHHSSGDRAAESVCAAQQAGRRVTRPPTAPPPLDPHAALFIDVDGTLLEIAPRPELVEVAPSLPDLLRRLGDEREGALALISGRPIAELDRLFRPWRGAAAGLHGIERRRPDGSYISAGNREADQAADAARDRLRPALADLARRHPGAWIEDKGRTLALHYRAVPEAGAAICSASEGLLQACGDTLRLIA